MPEREAEGNENMTATGTRGTVGWDMIRYMMRVVNRDQQTGRVTGGDGIKKHMGASLSFRITAQQPRGVPHCRSQALRNVNGSVQGRKFGVVARAWERKWDEDGVERTR